MDRLAAASGRVNACSSEIRRRADEIESNGQEVLVLASNSEGLVLSLSEELGRFKT